MTDTLNAKKSTVTDAPSKSKGNVLLLDDDKFLVDMYSMKFTKEGYAVHACLTVDDALAALRDGFAADAILFDIAMGGRDGFSFLAALVEEKLASKAVRYALTNQASDVEHRKALDMGASGYIIKATAIPSEVVNIIADALAEQRKAY